MHRADDRHCLIVNARHLIDIYDRLDPRDMDVKFRPVDVVLSPYVTIPRNMADFLNGTIAVRGRNGSATISVAVTGLSADG